MIINVSRPCQSCCGFGTIDRAHDCPTCHGKGGEVEQVEIPDRPGMTFHAGDTAFRWVDAFGAWRNERNLFLYPDRFVRHWFGYAMEAK